MNILKCGNGVTLAYDDTFNTDFVYLNIYLNYGAADDPAGMEGLARLTERLLVFNGMRDLNYYAGCNMDGTTSKERIRVGCLVHGGDIFPVLTKRLEGIAALSESGCSFGPERRRALYETQRIVKSTLIKNLETAERCIFGNGGYGNSVTGSERGLAAVSLAAADSHMQKMLTEKGLTISVTGAADIGGCKSLIEEYLPRAYGARSGGKAKIIPGPGEFYESVTHPLHIYDAYTPSLDNVKLHIYNTVLIEYLSHVSSDRPIAAKYAETRLHSFIALCFVSDGFYEHRVLTSALEEPRFEAVKRKVLLDNAYMFQDFKQYCAHMADMLFFDRSAGNDEILRLIKDFTFNDFRSYCENLEKNGIYFIFQ